MKNIFILSFALLVMFMSGACKKDEEFCDDPTDETCPNFDICTQAVAANSDFKIVSVVSTFADTTIDITTDTTYGGGQTYFKASITEGLASYAWKVGRDPATFTRPEVNLDFTAFVGDVEVTLETTANNTDMCLEASQLRDVKTQKIYFANISRIGSIFGTFKGPIAGSTDGQEYEVRVDNSSPPFRRLRGLPMPADCIPDEEGIPVYFDYQYFVSAYAQRRANRCRNLTVIGRINLEDSNELRIDYVYDDDDGKRKEVVFIGRRQ